MPRDSRTVTTLIVVFVAVVMSIAVAYWMLGMGSAFTTYEKLEFTTSVYTDVEGEHFVIKIKSKNTGSAALTIEQVLLNGKPAEDYDTTVEVRLSGTLEPGQELSGIISLTKGEKWKSRMMVEVMIRTKSGGEYPKSVILP